jgi:hypothetical protein
MDQLAFFLDETSSFQTTSPKGKRSERMRSTVGDGGLKALCKKTAAQANSRSFQIVYTYQVI